ncbi:uncharacterized protein LOC144632181 [Oculina patagonica]
METFEIVSDRELFSELFDNPINPLLINMSPFVDENNPMFYLQINGEAVLKWRDVYGRPRTVFDLLQRSILPLGYGLKPSAQERVGNALRESVRRFLKKIGNTKDGKKRKSLKAETWIKLAITPEEIERTPFDVMVENVEEKAASLYEEMRKKLEHTGKDFADVGKKQQQRHLTQIK